MNTKFLFKSLSSIVLLFAISTFVGCQNYDDSFEELSRAFDESKLKQKEHTAKLEAEIKELRESLALLSASKLDPESLLPYIDAALDAKMKLLEEKILLSIASNNEAEIKQLRIELIELIIERNNSLKKSLEEQIAKLEEKLRNESTDQKEELLNEIEILKAHIRDLESRIRRFERIF